MFILLDLISTWFYLILWYLNERKKERQVGIRREEMRKDKEEIKELNKIRKKEGRKER